LRRVCREDAAWAITVVRVAEDVSVAEVEEWAAGLEKVVERIGGRFARSEPRVRAGVYLRGLLSAAERKNGWTLAELAGVPIMTCQRIEQGRDYRHDLTALNRVSRALGLPKG